MFIVIEGLDYAGKSTITQALAEKLTQDTGRETVVLSNPGGEGIGQAIRQLIKSDHDRRPATDYFLFMANRVELHHAISDLLSQGKNVIVDRWDISSDVYQTHPSLVLLKQRTSLLSMPIYCKMNELPFPDQLIWLDCDYETTLTRRNQRGNDEGVDRYEAQSDESFKQWYDEKYQSYRDIVAFHAAGMQYPNEMKLWAEQDKPFNYIAPPHVAMNVIPYKQVMRFPIRGETVPSEVAEQILQVMKEAPIMIENPLTPQQEAHIAQFSEVIDQMKGELGLNQSTSQ